MPHPVRCIGCEPRRAKEGVVRTPIGNRVTKHSQTPLTAFLHDVFQGEVVSPDMVMCEKCFDMADYKDLLLVKEALRQKRSKGEAASKRPHIRRGGIRGRGTGGIRGRGTRGKAGRGGRTTARRPREDDEDDEDSLYQIGDVVPARPRKTKSNRRGRGASRGGGSRAGNHSPVASTTAMTDSNDSFNTPPLSPDSDEQEREQTSHGITVALPDSTDIKKRFSPEPVSVNKKFKSEETTEIIIKRELDDVPHIETTISDDVTSLVSSGRSSPLESVALSPELTAVSIEVIKTEISDNEDDEKVVVSSPVKNLDAATLSSASVRAVHVICADPVSGEDVASISPSLVSEREDVTEDRPSPPPVTPDPDTSIGDLLSSACSSQDIDSRSVSPTLDNNSPASIKVEDSDADALSDLAPGGIGQTVTHQCCSITFNSAKEKQEHYLKVHMKKKGVQCPLCSFIAPSDPCVEGHLRNTHGKTPEHHCPYCPRGFILLASLTHHRQNIHRKKVPPVKRKKKKGKHVCPTCGDLLLNRELLRLHNLERHGKDKFQCQYCPYETSSNLSLFRHDATVHQKHNFLNHLCSTCGMSFLDPQLLEDHGIDVHQLEKNYFCKKCGDSFTCANMLILHEKMHMPYKCMRCGMGFKKRENWVQHMRTYHNHDNTGVTVSSISADSEPMVMAVPGMGQGEDHVLQSSNNIMRGSSSLDSNSSSSNNFQQVYSFARGNGKKTTAARSVLAQEYDKDVAEQFIRNYRDKVHNNKITCIFCLKEVTSAHLRIHFKKHAGDFSFECPYCDKKCIQSTNLRKHIKNKHPGEPILTASAVNKPKKIPVLCAFCDHVAKDCEVLEEHLWQHIQEKTIVCDLCNVKFGMESNYKEHRRKHYFSSYAQCPHCNRTFSSIGFYEEHIEICQSNWLCKICNEVCRNETAYRKHRKSVHPDETTEKFTCPHLGCGRVFYERHRYDDHQITHGEEKRFQCPHCLKKFKRKRPLDDHIVAKHTSITCANCSEVFASLQDLVNHRTKSHLHELYRCDVCALVFWTKKTLRNHKLSLHTSDDAFSLVSCDKCPEVLPSGTTLKSHWQAHTASLMCSVHQCYEACEGTEGLTEHLSSHKFINYTCVYCQVEFTSESTLTEHCEDFHLSPSKCDVCQDKFYSDEYSETHALTHTNIHKYACTICSLYFPDRFVFVAHLKSSHEDCLDVCNVSECPIRELVLGCSLCEYLCYSDEDIDMHLQTHGKENAEKLYKMHEKKLSDTIIESLEDTEGAILYEPPTLGNAENSEHRLAATNEVCTTAEQIVQSSLLAEEATRLQTRQEQPVQFLMFQKDEDGNLIVAVHAGNDDDDVTDEKAVMRAVTNCDAISSVDGHNEGKQLVLKVEGNEEGEQQLMVCSEGGGGGGGGGRLVFAKGDNGELVLTKEDECLVQDDEEEGCLGQNLLLGNSSTEQLEMLLGDALRNRTLSAEGLGDQLTALLTSDGQIILSQD